MMCEEKQRRRPLGREYHGPVPPEVMIRAKSPTNYNPEKMILESRRRQQELDINIDACAKQKLRDQNIDLMTQANRKALANRIRGEIDRRLKVHGFSLEERRNRLRELLRQEDQDYITTMQEAEETTLERQAKMRARINSLRDRKERERLHFCQQKYDQQFREQCEELRSTLSKREQDRVCAERVEQLWEKEQQARDKKAQDDMFHQLMLNDIQEKMAREEREALEARERDRGQLDNILKQKAAMEAQKEEAKRQRADEQRLLKEQAALDKMQVAAEQAEKLQKQEGMRNAIDHSLRTKLRRKAREEQEELANDLTALEKLMEETRSEQHESQQRKITLREEDRRYREYLAQMREEEKEQQKETDRHIQEKVDEGYQKQVDRWRTLNHMRRDLLNDVIAGRQKQIQDRLEENERLKAQNLKEREELMKKLEAQRQYDLQQQRKRKANSLQYQADLAAQILDKEQAEEEARRFRDYEYRMGQQAERELQEKLKGVLDSPGLDRLHPMRRAAAAAEAAGAGAMKPGAGGHTAADSEPRIKAGDAAQGHRESPATFQDAQDLYARQQALRCKANNVRFNADLEEGCRRAEEALRRQKDDYPFGQLQEQRYWVQPPLEGMLGAQGWGDTDQQAAESAPHKAEDCPNPDALRKSLEDQDDYSRQQALRCKANKERLEKRLQGPLLDQAGEEDLRCQGHGYPTRVQTEEYPVPTYSPCDRQRPPSQRRVRFSEREDDVWLPPCDDETAPEGAEDRRQATERSWEDQDQYGKDQAQKCRANTARLNQRILDGKLRGKDQAVEDTLSCHKYGCPKSGETAPERFPPRLGAEAPIQYEKPCC
ncbi:cilia- and flagella-associated protein 53-like [Babylonia areolata]|uniref:cilia- and flagella-associated protein 53-like n=1 Tax=Babylonia areolata TaxID=304850 RepID=UPI003FCF550A